MQPSSTRKETVFLKPRGYTGYIGPEKKGIAAQYSSSLSSNAYTNKDITELWVCLWLELVRTMLEYRSFSKFCLWGVCPESTETAIKQNKRLERNH